MQKIFWKHFMYKRIPLFGFVKLPFLNSPLSSSLSLSLALSMHVYFMSKIFFVFLLLRNLKICLQKYASDGNEFPLYKNLLNLLMYSHMNVLHNRLNIIVIIYCCWWWCCCFEWIKNLIQKYRLPFLEKCFNKPSESENPFTCLLIYWHISVEFGPQSNWSVNRRSKLYFQFLNRYSIKRALLALPKPYYDMVILEKSFCLPVHDRSQWTKKDDIHGNISESYTRMHLKFMPLCV